MTDDLKARLRHGKPAVWPQLANEAADRIEELERERDKLDRWLKAEAGDHAANIKELLERAEAAERERDEARAEVERLRGALKEIADAAPDDKGWINTMAQAQAYRARAALTSDQPEDEEKVRPEVLANALHDDTYVSPFIRSRGSVKAQARREAFEDAARIAETAPEWRPKDGFIWTGSAASELIAEALRTKAKEQSDG